jgi:copper chaperone NosL
MKLSKYLMIGAAILPLFLFVFPMWSVSLEAPQYPIPLEIVIFVDHLGEGNYGDIQNFDLMNHYVGMAKLPTEMIEHVIFPKVIIGISILGLIIGFLGKKKLYLVWFGIMILLGIAGIYDFYLWLYDYGHNLDPKAAIQLLDAYQPPIIGTKEILNFTVRSYPAFGSIILGIGILLSPVAFYFAGKEERKESN